MKLLLIDGNAIMHRAFHALPPLTNKEGIQTNAVYGFLSMLITITNKLEPTHLIVCFDRPEPTFRKGVYAGYQAQRPKMDDVLSQQFDLIKEILHALNIPIYEKAGFEADDVIGTLAWQATNPKLQMNSSSDQPLQVIIVTGDRDILQLVTDHVSVFMPIQGLSNGKEYTPDDVIAKYGVRPDQIVDYKALCGDPSDNYPGVRGIGPKTAHILLQKFGTLENLYDAIHHQDEKARELKDRVVQALSEYAEDAGMAKKLARILHDVPVTLALDDAKFEPFDRPEVIDIFQTHGFASLARRVFSGDQQPRKPTGYATEEPKKDISATKETEQLSLV